MPSNHTFPVSVEGQAMSEKLHPAVLLIGMVIGWILGSRAAQDAMAMEMKRRDERRK